MSDEKALDKIDIANELKTLSPIEKRSIELKKLADKVEIKDKPTYLEAKKIRRNLVSHRTSTKDLRLTFTRKLDNLKDQFIKKQDEVLEPSVAGEDLIKEKIAVWEKLEAERKEAEEQRINGIVDKIMIIQLDIDRRTGNLEDVKRARAAVKMELSLLDPKDRNKVVIKRAAEQTREWLDETEEFITDRIEQERVAEEQRKEQLRLEAERKELEEEKVSEAKVETPEPVSAPVEEADKGNSPLVKASEPESEVDSVNETIANIAKKNAKATDEAITAFLRKQGYEIHLDNIQATNDLLRATGYRLIDEVETIEGEAGLIKTKHTYLYVKVIDQIEFITEARLNMSEE